MFTDADRVQIASQPTRDLLSQLAFARALYPALWQKILLHAPRSLMVALLDGLDEWQQLQDQIDRQK